MEAQTWYVYTLSDPDTKIPFYVGKGSGKRMYHHEKWDGSNWQKRAKIREILRRGKEVAKEKVAEFEDEQAAYDFERELIQQHRDTLLNICGCKGKKRIKKSQDLPSEKGKPVSFVPQSPSPDEEKIFTLEEVAETLRVSTRTIQREVKTGKLKAFKVGHALRFKANDLAEYQRNQAVELVPPQPGRPKKAEE